MTSTSRWSKIKETVASALELDPSQRRAFLAQACGDDTEVLTEVESLLTVYSRVEAHTASPDASHFFDSPEAIYSIGNYHLLRKLGEGGMGQVWLAEQTSPVRRQVAIKLIRAGMLHPIVLQRFQAERQSLAIMEHPSIAKVFDAGTTPNGQPYFVMEYVEGLPITRYCYEHKLSLRDRLHLFIQVCEGVQHAHQKAIIHRDLKPANILVIELDGKPRPRIIDFGLAKTILPPAPGETMFTQAGVFLGTPGYTSPEQIDPNVRDVDTRTDVYSLGVILYELLTGSLPFDTKKFREEPLDKILKIMREVDPPSPSTRVTQDAKTSPDNAKFHSTLSRELATQLRGDLDWITLTALEKDRERRYASAADLAADVERYLENKPVLARPATVAYRVRKYVRRHVVSVSIAAGIALLLVAFVATQAIQLRRITRERDRANRITEFMMKMFKVSQPSESRGNTVTAREILDKASADIETGLTKDPELQAELSDVMGNVYTSIGLYKRGGALLQRGAETRKRVLGTNDPKTFESISNLAWNLQRQGHYDEAEKLAREALEGQRRLLGSDHKDTLRTASDLSWTLYEQGKYAESEKLLTQTLESERRTLGASDKQTLIAMSTLAWTIAAQGRYPEAEKMETEALNICRTSLSTDDPEIQVAMNNLAGIYQWQGRYADAEKLNRELIALETRVRGLEHPDTLIAMNNLGNVLAYEKKYDEGITFQQQALDIQRRVVGPEHHDTLVTASSLANTLAGAGRFDEADKLLRQTLEVQIRLFGPDSPSAANTTYNMACVATKRGNFDEAFADLNHALDHGLAPADALGVESDPDLKPLQADPRLAAFLSEAKQRVAAVQKQK